jgi:hypothetical protein
MQVLFATLGQRNIFQAFAAVFASFIVLLLVFCWPQLPVSFIIKFGISRVSVLLKELAIEGGRGMLATILGAGVHRLRMIWLSLLQIRPALGQFNAVLRLHLIKHVLTRGLIDPESVLFIII